MHGWMVVGTSPAAIRVPSVIAMTAAVGADRHHRPAADRIGLGRPVRRADHGADPDDQLLRTDRPVVRRWSSPASPAPRWRCCTPWPLEADGGRASRAALRPGRWLAYAVLLVAVGGYLNELSLLVLAAHAVTVLLARYGRRLAGALGGHRGRRGDPGPAARRAQRRGGRRRRLDPPARPGEPADPLPRLLRRDERGRRAAFCCAVAAVLPPGPGAPRVRARVVAPGRRLAAVGRRAAAGGPRRAADPRVAGRPARCTSTATSSTARPGPPCWPAAGRTGSGSGWPRPRPAQRAAGGCCSGRPAWSSAWRALVLQLGAAAAGPHPAEPRCSTSAARPGTWPRMRSRATGCCSSATFFRKARLGYPADYRNVSDFAMAQSPQRPGTFQGRDKPLAVVQPLMLDYQRIWVVGRAPSAHLRPARSAPRTPRCAATSR